MVMKNALLGRTVCWDTVPAKLHFPSLTLIMVVDTAAAIATADDDDDDD